MTPEIDLKLVQRKVYLSFFQDGLWDVLLGSFVLAWGLGILTDTAALTGVWFITAYFSIVAVKKRVTYPRIGHMKIPLERRTNIRLLIAGIVAALAGVGAFLVVRSEIARPLWDYFPLMLGAIIGTVVFLIAYWWQINRWYAYGATIIVGVSLHQWQNVAFSWSFIIPGIVILSAGIAMFIRFLHQYPKPIEEGRVGGEQR